MTKQNALVAFVNQAKPSIEKVLPKHVSYDKFERCLLTAGMNNPDIGKATTQSLFTAAIKSATDGLPPDGKHATIITFNSKDGIVANYIPMITGLLKLVRNSGEIQSITTNMIYEKDKFDYWVDEKGEHLEFKPNMFAARGNPIGVFAQAVTKDGGCYIEVLTKEDIAKIKKSSRGSKYGPWSGDFESEMWKKSALKRLIKRLPLSTDLSVDTDETDVTDAPVTFGETEVVEDPQPEVKKIADATIPNNLEASVNGEAQPI